MFVEPPDILFTSTEMLNQRMSSNRYANLFGIGVSSDRRPDFVLLDEVHSYEGVHGAHVALLLRRWRRASQARAHMVGLSATLADAPRFFADLVGIGPGSVAEVSPQDAEMTESGNEYMSLALRGDPASGSQPPLRKHPSRYVTTAHPRQGLAIERTLEVSVHYFYRQFWTSSIAFTTICSTPRDGTRSDAPIAPKDR